MKLIKMKILNFILVFFILLAAGCMPAPIITEISETDTADNPEVLPVGIPLPTISVDTIETLVADPNYLKGCRELNPRSYNEQAVYKGITPGKTTTLEVKKSLEIQKKYSLHHGTMMALTLRLKSLEMIPSVQST